MLFIVGGAFAGLEDIIAERVGRRSVGFTNDDVKRRPSGVDPFTGVRPEDLHAFGLIPEFIGRLPVVATVPRLDETALRRILTEPRNALVKQFTKLFELDGVCLEFAPDAIAAVAEKAIERGTGARGLRAILEETLGDVMFEVPSRDDIAQVVITGDAVRGEAPPRLVTRARAGEPAA